MTVHLSIPKITQLHFCLKKVELRRSLHQAGVPHILRMDHRLYVILPITR